jgi:alpha-mannosidase
VSLDQDAAMNVSKRLVLVCNSHLDPVWLWPWEEGVAATLATFRAAAQLCDEFDGFVFCHNEALLYQWVEEYEPALFERIRTLVGERRWHIMGGWYLQPDCNLPNGESFVRQILTGRRYFAEKFGVEPRVAVNLDPFGHSRGLVQILRKSGYTGYLFCRPDNFSLALPADDVVWVGYDGSTLVAHRAADHYNSSLGQARAKTTRWLRTHEGRADGLLLWGVGNHGGGPSREDLTALRGLMRDTPDREIVHGRPEDYFDALEAQAATLPRVEHDLNPWAVGCYTSMSTVKRAHRRLESRLFGTERMLTSAAAQGLLEYPRAQLTAAIEAMLFCQFHDILPGSSVSEVETQAIQRLGHGLDIVDRLRARAFFALLSGQPAAAAGEYPLFVHNPHPFPVTDFVVCEFQPPEPNVDAGVFLLPEVTASDGSPVATQLEKESCNIQMDQRKRLVFRTRLAAACTTRFSCRIRTVPRPPAIAVRPLAGLFHHAGSGCVVEIDAATGLLHRYRVGHHDYIEAGSFRPLVMTDSPDPWGMKVRAFRDLAGEFRLMDEHAAALHAGVATSTLAPVRIIEDGPVRTIVEALFAYRRSAVCLRYVLPKDGAELMVQARVSWCEKDAMLKFALPTTIGGMRVRSQVPYGVEARTREAEELLWHSWLACVSPDGSRALTVVNDGVYGFDFSGAELRLSCLRSPAHAGHPVDDVTPVVRQDRFEPRVDQGEHVFRFWLQGGPASERLTTIDREAATKDDEPMALNVFPHGGGQRVCPGPTLSDGAVQITAVKVSEDGRSMILRLFEPTGQARTTTLSVPALDVALDVTLSPFEIRTLAIDLATRTVDVVDLLERRSPSSITEHADHTPR